MTEAATKAMPLARPVGQAASAFYETLIARGMAPGMTWLEARALMTMDEWAAYERMIRDGLRERNPSPRVRYAIQPGDVEHEPLSTRTRPYDDELAQDEREHGA